MGIIRLLLALSVVLAHTAPVFGNGLVGGPLAVQSFFIISGFYMSLILNEKYVGQNGSYKLFITNRFMRLYPIYWVVLLAFTAYCLVAFYGFHQSNFIGQYNNYGPRMRGYSIVFLVFSNLTVFFQDVVMFLGLNPQSGQLYFTADFNATNPPLYTFLAVPQAWSVGIELAFSLMAPFLVRRSMKVIVPIIALCFAARFLSYRGAGLNFDPWTHRFFPFELAWFLIGTVAYRMYKKIERMAIKKQYLFCFFGGLVASIVLYSYLPGASLKHYAFLLQFALSVPFIFKLTKKWKMDAAIGDLSYPVYIVHIALIVAISSNPFVILPASVVVAFLLNRVVANPVEKYRQSRLKKAAPKSSPVVKAVSNYVA